MADITTDPTTACYSALWGCLVARSDFADNVPAGNRIRYDGDARDPEKQAKLTAAHPECTIALQSGVPHLDKTSNSTELIDTYMVRLRSGDKRMDLTDIGMAPLRWSIIRGVHQWKTVLAALTWNGGGRFVVDVKLISTTDAIDRDYSADGTEGWTTVIVAEVRMWFSKAAMLAA